MSHVSTQIDLDLTGTYCPMAFVKLRVFADALPDNAVFTAVFEQTNANQPLVRSIKDLGHKILDEKIFTPNSETKLLFNQPLGSAGEKLTLVTIKVQVKKLNS